MYLDAMNGFVDAFELEQDKIGTKIKDNNGTEFVYCGSEYHNLENMAMEEITEDLGEPAYRIRQSLRKKILDGTNLYEKHSTV